VANIKSAIKRVAIAERNRLHNKSYKSAVRTLMKKSIAAMSANQTNPSPEAQQTMEEAMSAAFSKIDRAVKRGVLHRNTGARRKARLAKALKAHQAASAS
jgi:small subunit ribosomal protein S20